MPDALPQDEWVEVDNLEQDLDLEILSTRLEDGRVAVYAFTSERALTDWAPEGGPYVRIRVAALLSVLFEYNHDHDVVVVDPGNRRFWAVTREEYLGPGAE